MKDYPDITILPDHEEVLRQLEAYRKTGDRSAFAAPLTFLGEGAGRFAVSYGGQYCVKYAKNSLGYMQTRAEIAAFAEECPAFVEMVACDAANCKYVLTKLLTPLPDGKLGELTGGLVTDFRRLKVALYDLVATYGMFDYDAAIGYADAHRTRYADADKLIAAIGRTRDAEDGQFLVFRQLVDFWKDSGKRPFRIFKKENWCLDSRGGGTVAVVIDAGV